MVDSSIFYFLFSIYYPRFFASPLLALFARAQIFDFQLDAPLVVPFVKFKLINNVNLLSRAQLVGPLALPEGDSAPNLLAIVQRQPQVLVILTDGFKTFYGQIPGEKTGGWIAIAKRLQSSDGLNQTGPDTAQIDLRIDAKYRAQSSHIQTLLGDV